MTSLHAWASTITRNPSHIWRCARASMRLLFFMKILSEVLQMQYMSISADHLCRCTLQSRFKSIFTYSLTHRGCSRSRKLYTRPCLGLFCTMLFKLLALFTQEHLATSLLTNDLSLYNFRTVIIAIHVCHVTKYLEHTTLHLVLQRCAFLASTRDR